MDRELWCGTTLGPQALGGKRVAVLAVHRERRWSVLWGGEPGNRPELFQWRCRSIRAALWGSRADRPDSSRPSWEPVPRQCGDLERARRTGHEFQSHWLFAKK